MKVATLVISTLLGPLVICSAGPKQCATCYHMHIIGQNKAAPRIMIGGREQPPRIFTVAGKRVETLQDFQAVVASLPRGSELIWESCETYSVLPIIGGPIQIAAVQNLCANHGVFFSQFAWGY